jgi:hypothetical protein
VGSRAQWRHALMGAWRHAGLVHVGQGHSQEVAVGEGPRQGLAVTRHTPLEYACYDTCAHPLCWPVVLHPQVCGCKTTPGGRSCGDHNYFGPHPPHARGPCMHGASLARQPSAVLRQQPPAKPADGCCLPTARLAACHTCHCVLQTAAVFADVKLPGCVAALLPQEPTWVM